MTTTTDLSALVIDGTKLRQAREERNLSVSEVAMLCTLSREQVQHIEDGGDRPFYTPAHKLLAIRKYAAAMGIPYDDIVAGPGADDTMPVPDNAPASLMVHGDGEEATDLRLAAVERNAEIRRMILIGAVTATILLAFYAKMRGTPDSPPPATQAVVSDAAAGDNPRTEGAEASKHDATTPPASVTTAPATRVATAPAPAAAPASPATAPANAAVAPASPSQTTTGPAGANAARTESVASAAPVKTPSPAPAAASTSSAADAKLAADNRPSAGEPCTVSLGNDLKTWTPTYQRKADTRLFFVSTKEATVCVRDASGKAALLTLKARTGQAYNGKPPYVVHSPQLSDIEIYLQGMRARVPPQTPALRLQATPVIAPDAG